MFKVGDRVILKDESHYKSQQVGIGTVMLPREDNWINIEWEGGNVDNYPPEDVLYANELKEEELGEFKIIVEKDSLFLQDRNGDVVEILKKDSKMIINKLKEVFK